MKKLVNLLLLLLLIIVKIYAQSPDTVHRSLNDINQGDARNMITFYQQNQNGDTKPQAQSIWIDRTTFGKMYALLKKEHDADSIAKNPHYTDGLRIYFASYSKNNKGQLDNTVIIVATQFWIANDSTPSGAEHIDNYVHDKNDPLFNTQGENDQVYKKRFYRRGDQLYRFCSKCNTPSCTNDTNDPHYITRDSAQNMVRRFGEKSTTTRSEWFDLKLIQALSGATTADGIRIYFAKNDKNSKDMLGLAHPQVVKDKEAFIWEVTTSNGVWPFKDHKDNYELMCELAAIYLLPYKKNDALQYKRNRLLQYQRNYILSDDGGTSPGGQDNGELCPDNCIPPQ